MGATTPGRSRSQASETSVGETCSPRAAVATASTMVVLRPSRNRSTKFGKSRDAALESLGTPLRYFPDSTPRANGDHGNRPKPSDSAAGASSRSGSRWIMEYSTSLATNGIRADSSSENARADCQPE